VKTGGRKAVLFSQRNLSNFESKERLCVLRHVILFSLFLYSGSGYVKFPAEIGDDLVSERRKL
jgi:hypothetical protein